MHRQDCSGCAPPLSRAILSHIASDWPAFADVRAAARALSQKSRLANALLIAVNEVRVALAAALLCSDPPDASAESEAFEDAESRAEAVRRALRLYSHSRAIISDCGNSRSFKSARCGRRSNQWWGGLARTRLSRRLPSLRPHLGQRRIPSRRASIFSSQPLRKTCPLRVPRRRSALWEGAASRMLTSASSQKALLSQAARSALSLTMAATAPASRKMVTTRRRALESKPMLSAQSASWENDENAKRALGPVIAKWLASGVLAYVAWDDRMPILLQRAAP
jgi:hypothetical protein